MNMESLLALLEKRGPAITDRAMDSMERAHLAHYRTLGDARTRQLVVSLHEVVTGTLRSRDAGAMLRHVEAIAGERFQGGFGLIEVQTAFNALEESTWREITGALPAAELAEALGLVSSALGIGKDALARAFVAQATEARVPSLDLGSMFAGT